MVSPSLRAGARAEHGSVRRDEDGPDARVSGLCVAVCFDGAAVTESMLYEMAGEAAYRGPDGAHTWLGEGAGLLQQVRRDTGREADGTTVAAGLTLVAAARIDNRADLCPQLANAGLLAGDEEDVTDADVILAAYRLWGDAAPAHLIGDFAFVVYDQGRRRLLAARDPLGMRPLHYRNEPWRRVLLASDISQLLAAPGVPCAIDELGIACTIAGPYLPPDRTVYSGISQLAPAHALAVDEAGARTWRYWAPDPARRVEMDDEATIEAYREVFTTAVAARTATSGPVGVLLSGGMDSGALTATAGWLRESDGTRAEVRTYSWAFADAELQAADERAVSDVIVERYGLPATGVPGDGEWPLSQYPAHGPHRDDPFVWVYQGLIDRSLAMARDDGAVVMLTGDRGDEVTGDWVFDELGLLRRGRLREVAEDVRLAAGRSGRRSAVRSTILRPGWRAVRRSRRPTDVWPAAPWVPADLARRVDLDDVIAEQCSPVLFDGPARSARAGRIFMPQGARIALQAERNGAMHGLGTADPFSDRRVVELVLALPQWRVQRRGHPKHLARQAMAGIMPESARVGAGKSIPLPLFDRAFRDRSVDTVRQLLTSSEAAARGWLNVDRALAMFEQYRATGSARYDFWWPLCVEMWLRRWWQ